MPAPFFVKENAPDITPPTVKVFAVVVNVLLAERATAPVPKLRGLVPVNIKSAFQFCALFVLSVMAAPEVLSIVPADMVNVPVPMADALLMFSVPAFNVVPPL